MSRLAKHSMGRQRELFARAEIPDHTPLIEHFAGVERRRVHHEPRPVLWEGMASWVRQIAAFPEGWRRSASQDERFEKTAKLLDVEKIRICRHADSLELVEEWLADWRNNDLGQVFSRARLGELLVECRNRIVQLRLGREQPKERGPRFDATKLPDDALDRLIQTHRDIAVVDQLRAVRLRRQRHEPQ